MKSLAEFVMRDRFRALLVVIAGAGSMLLCWLSASVVALVTLRKGAMAGAWLMLWGLLPAGALVLLVGDTGPLSLMLGTLVLALILRGSVSLSLTLLASVGVALVTGAGLMLFSTGLLEELVGAFDRVLAALEQRVAVPEGAEAVQLLRPTLVQVAGMMGTGTAFCAVLCLLLARYWQAQLYNPGGFGSEFRALSLPPAVATGLALGAAAVFAAGTGLRSWGMALLLPLTFCGLALVHARIHTRSQGGAWLAGFYVAWLVFDLVKLAVVLAALADSYLDFRGRWAGGGGGSGGDTGR